MNKTTGNMNWGLIGASDIAAHWVLPAIRTQGQAVGVLSADYERGKKYAKEHLLAKAYRNLEELLADSSIDAVYISTTNELHKEQTIEAAAAGKHVLCEKPLALTVEDAVQMTQACDKAGVLLATNHHLRNAASHLKIKELLTEGVLGTILSCRVFHAIYLPAKLQGWRLTAAAAGGGVILDITVHSADTLRFHLEEDPTEVTAMKQNGGLGKNGIEDGAMCILNFPSGILAQTHDSFTSLYAGTGIEFHGTEGSIHARNVMDQEPRGDIILTSAKGEEKILFTPHNLYARAISLFTAAVHGEGKPAADGIDGIKSLAIALAVKESTTTGKTVKVYYGEY